ncbi:MAG TPA: hypothetical protein VKF37_10270 [Chloroflexota bacterium]|nr:hypothetical protein [Chloroflexota bacterium]
MDSDSYTLAGARYPLPAWAQLFIARVDHSPARWKRPAAHGITAAEALRLLEGLCASKLDGLTDWIGSQEAPDGPRGRRRGTTDRRARPRAPARTMAARRSAARTARRRGCRGRC